MSIYDKPPPCGVEWVGDDDNDLHMCALPAGHDGPHECSDGTQYDSGGADD